jgi:hypothetical protein
VSEIETEAEEGRRQPRLRERERKRERERERETATLIRHPTISSFPSLSASLPLFPEFAEWASPSSTGWPP